MASAGWFAQSWAITRARVVAPRGSASLRHLRNMHARTVYLGRRLRRPDPVLPWAAGFWHGPVATCPGTAGGIRSAILWAAAGELSCPSEVRVTFR